MDEQTFDRLWTQLTAEAEDAILSAAPRPQLRPEDVDIPVDDLALLEAVLRTDARSVVDSVMERSWVPAGLLDEYLPATRRGRRARLPMGLLLQAAAEESELSGAPGIGAVHLLLALLSFPELDAARVLDDLSVTYYRVQRRMRVMRLP